MSPKMQRKLSNFHDFTKDFEESFLQWPHKPKIYFLPLNPQFLFSSLPINTTSELELTTNGNILIIDNVAINCSPWSS